MLVVSDASPINILIRIRLIDFLPQLYGRILIPTMVADELADPRAPTEIQQFMSDRPAWLEVAAPNNFWRSVVSMTANAPR